jgi:polyhydroxyalkanoate synthase
LADAIPQAHVLLPPSGHIGMVVGSRAEEGLWRPLADWLVARLE